jgi:cell division septation protein DedD
MPESEGVSTRYLLGAFFAVVLLCAVFFSLGYFLGYREGRPPDSPVTEHVAAASDVPATVNASSNPSSAETGGAQPSDAQSTQPADSGTDNQGGSPEAASPAQNSGAAPPGLPATSTGAGNTSPTPPGEDAGTGGVSNSNDGSAADDAALTPRSVPSGILIQVGALSSRQEASKVAQTLRARGYPALVLTPAQVGAKDTFFRVIAGPYRNHGAAETALRKLVKEGYRPFIRQ